MAKTKKSTTKKATVTEGATRGKSSAGKKKKSNTKPKSAPPAVKTKQTKADKVAKAISKRGKFEYKRLSASMMKTWLQCKRKFHRHYIDNVPEPANVSFSLGNSCHSALEAANLSLIKNPRQLTDDEIEQFVQVFRDELAKVYVDDMSIFDAGEEMVRSELASINPKEKIIQAEKQFDLITPEGVRLYGFIDKVVEVDKSTIEILDYKTSVNPMSYDEALHDVQMSMYELVAAILYPQYKKRLVSLQYLRSGKKLTTMRTPIAQFNFRKQLLSVDTAIKEYVANVGNGSECPDGTTNTLCNWCSFRTNCPAFISQLSNVDSEFPTLEGMTDNKFIEEYNRVKIISKALDDYKGTLKLWALHRIESDPEVPIADDELQVNTLSKTRKSYDPKVIARYVDPEVLIKLVSINNSKLKSFLKSLDDSTAAKIEQSAEVKFNSPEIRFKKVN